MDKNHSGNKKYSVAVVGATGLIGRKILGTLYKRRFPISGLRVFASEKSEGKKISFGGETVYIWAVLKPRIKDDLYDTN